MLTALSLARRGLGIVWPNPAVGCVIVREDQQGRIVGRGWTQPSGRPHAETEALKRAGHLAKGGTAYVSLEPCSHYGETGPCTEALIDAGIRRVVVAASDPDPRVSGSGIARLRDAGLDVLTDVCREEGTLLNRGFFLRITQGRPLITLKMATSLDGKIATHLRDSRWISGPESRAHAHRLRAEHDAVLIGSETAIADDPELTCRLPGLEPHTPIRIVLDSRLRIDPESKLVQSAWVFPLWIVTTAGQDQDALEVLQKAGAEVIELPPAANGRPDIGDVVKTLAARGLTRVLVEGGGGVAGSFIEAGLVDDIVWFRAPKLIGGDGIPALAAIGTERVADAPAFILVDTFKAGDDLMETYRLRS